MTTVLTKNLISRYEARDLLGHGGMGTVIQAYDSTLNRDVAIKQLSAGLQQNESAVEIFLTEARALASLSHLNLVNVYDIIEAPEGVAMIQEFVHGTTLEKEVDTRGALPEDEVLLIAIQLICVVGYLHHMNYLHRDLKPANIILQPDGYLRLVDFGLSRKFDQMLARGTEVRGTPAYMAPEQIKSRELTPSTDIYQIGVTLYEMLTGTLPFETNGDTYALAYAHVNEKPPRVQEKRPDVSKELSSIVYKCLKKKPKNRFSDCQELLDALAPLYQRLCGHSIEESGYMVPFGAVGEGDMELDDGSSAPNTSGRYLAVPKNTNNRISTDQLRVSDHNASRGLHSLEDDSSVSVQEFEQMEERLEQLEHDHRQKNRRMVMLVGVLLALIGVIAAAAVIVTQSSSTSTPESSNPASASSMIAQDVEELPSSTAPVEQGEEQVNEPGTPDTLQAEPVESVEPVVAEPTPEPVVKTPAPPQKKRVARRRRTKKKSVASQKTTPDKASPSDKPPASPGSYLDGFQKVGADDKKLDDDLKALSNDL
jgi:serine/threonine protein kinase